MTTEHLALTTESTSMVGKTLFDVGEAIFANNDLGERVRCNIISSIRTLSRVLERRPQHLPAALNLLRPMMDQASPEAFRVNPRRWQSVRSSVSYGIKLSGFFANSVS
jgi:hypothetical protein